MSRLDSFLRRIAAQRDCLDFAARSIRGLPGPVLELGLGNGRTYDHLRERLPDREIFAFDRRVAAHPASRPDDAKLILGEICDTLPRAGPRVGAPAALAHCDLGTGVASDDARLATIVGPRLDALMASGALVVSDQPFAVAGWSRVDPPAGVAPDRYFLYRTGGPPVAPIAPVTDPGRS